MCAITTHPTLRVQIAWRPSCSKDPEGHWTAHLHFWMKACVSCASNTHPPLRVQIVWMPACLKDDVPMPARQEPKPARPAARPARQVARQARQEPKPAGPVPKPARQVARPARQVPKPATKVQRRVGAMPPHLQVKKCMSCANAAVPILPVQSVWMPACPKDPEAC